MFSIRIKILLTCFTLFFPLAAFSFDISCKDEKGKPIFNLSYEKPLSTQISNKLGIKTAVLKGFNDANDRYSFIANSFSEETADNIHTLTLFGFGQITKKSAAGKRNTSSIKTIKLHIPNEKSTKNFGTVEFITTTFFQNEEQKFDYSRCHFEALITKEIKIYNRILDALNTNKK
ncbi:hypothetical protein [Silvanigrella aquatica]|uniref:Uncharacterized protein n=1 Tax=Silvanigrella aquatica TaxID=1915309 RepID=A0A1L4D1Z1_9BACT|nr:hypothetical protein [Silvanigrella aquatica]APJ04223.1 hypothetical protein AXG55_10020 [Silvanigrella aquatica]